MNASSTRFQPSGTVAWLKQQLVTLVTLQAWQTPPDEVKDGSPGLWARVLGGSPVQPPDSDSRASDGLTRPISPKQRLVGAVWFLSSGRQCTRPAPYPLRLGDNLPLFLLFFFFFFPGLTQT